MTTARAILWLLTLAVAFGLGHFTAAPARHPELSTVDSLREALADRDWLRRSHGFNAFLQGLSPDNLPEALELLEARSRYLSDEEIHLFMLAWSRFDAQAAFERALLWPTHSKTRASAAAIRAWAYRDPQNARVALRLVEDNPVLKPVLQDSLVAGWIRNGDREGVTEYVAALPAGPSRQRFTNTLAAEMMRVGPETVMEWAEEVPDDANQDYKRVVFDKASNVLAAVDPARTGRWIEGHIDRDFASGAPVLIVRRWVESGDPVGALDWAMALPEGAARHEAITAALSRWMMTDLEATQVWLRKAEPEDDLDPSLRTLVRKAIKSDPASAIAWAERIHDPELRYSVLIGAGHNWLRRDPEAAEAWLARSGLPEETQDAIRDPALAKRGPPIAGRGRRGRRARKTDPVQKTP